MASSHGMFQSTRWSSSLFGGGRSEQHSGSLGNHRGTSRAGCNSLPARVPAPRRVSQPNDGNGAGSLGNGPSGRSGRQARQPQSLQSLLNSDPRNLRMQEAEEEESFNPIDMSQLTMTQEMVFENDATSVGVHSHRSNRSNQSCGVPVTTTYFPPLHQSSASSNASSCGGSNQASTGSAGLEGRGSGMIMPSSTSNTVRGGGRIGPFHPSWMLTPQAPRVAAVMPHSHRGSSMPAPSSHHRNSNLMTQMDPTQELLRMTTPQHTGNPASGRTLMRFPQAASCKQNLFGLKTPYTSNSCSQQPSNMDGNESRCKQSFSSEPAQSAVNDSATEPDKKWKDVHAELEQQVAERMDRFRREVEESLDARFAKIDAEREKKVAERLRERIVAEINTKREASVTERMTKLESKENEVQAQLAHASKLAEVASDRNSQGLETMKRFQEKEGEVYTKLAHLLEENRTALAQATESGIEKLNLGALIHLASISKATDSAIFKIGQAVERAASSMMDQGSNLVQTAMPLIQNSVKTLVGTLFATLADDKENSPVAASGETGLSSPSTSPALPLCDEVGATQGFVGGVAFEADARFVAVDPGSHDQCKVVVSVKEAVLIGQGETQPVASRLRERKKRRINSDVRTARKSPRSRRPQSCVTPTIETPAVDSSPISQISSEQSPRQLKRGVPREVLVATDNSGSPASGLDEKVFVSPPPDPPKKRGRSSMLKGVRVTQTRTNRTKSPSARCFEDEEDPFEFL